MIEDFDGSIVEALKSVPETTWTHLFQNFARNKEEQIVGTADADLAKLKASVLAIKEIHSLFIQQRNRKLK